MCALIKTPCADYSDELRQQQAAWERKASVRALYRRWYARVVASLSPARPVVEIGAGCGNFKAFFPEAIATDVVSTGPWVDRLVNANALPFEAGEVGNFVLIDCLHHLPRPWRFLRGAARALKPGGRLVLLEPAMSPWARVVWRLFHHEPFDLRADPFAGEDQPEPPNPGRTFSNMALPALLFVKHLEETRRRLPELEVISIEHSDVLVYPATGGFSYLTLVSGACVKPLHAAEGWVTHPFRRWLGLRLWVVLERKRES